MYIQDKGGTSIVLCSKASRVEETYKQAAIEIISFATPIWSVSISSAKSNKGHKI